MLAFFEIDVIFYVIELIIIAMLVFFLLYKENEKISVIIRLIASCILAIICIMQLITEIQMKESYLSCFLTILLIIVWCANIIHEKNILNNKDD